MELPPSHNKLTHYLRFHGCCVLPESKTPLDVDRLTVDKRKEFPPFLFNPLEGRAAPRTPRVSSPLSERRRSCSTPSYFSEPLAPCHKSKSLKTRAFA